jgi:hypothetical protein
MSNILLRDVICSGFVQIFTIRSFEYDKGVQHSPKYHGHVEVSAAATEE